MAVKWPRRMMGRGVTGSGEIDAFVLVGPRCTMGLTRAPVIQLD